MFSVMSVCGCVSVSALMLELFEIGHFYCGKIMVKSSEEFK